jgi:hypothetical protein
MNIDIDIDVEDVYYNMSEREKNILIDFLISDGFIDFNFFMNKVNKTPSLEYEFFISKIDKIAKSYYQLSNEDLNTLDNIVNKL